MSFRLLFLFLFISSFCFAQLPGPNSRDPEPEYHKTYPPARKKSSKKKSDLNAYYDQLVVEYHQRMKSNVRKYKKMARKMKKPKYSDPMYFGHKRKPKKRQGKKRKFCKECRIIH